MGEEKYYYARGFRHCFREAVVLSTHKKLEVIAGNVDLTDIGVKMGDLGIYSGDDVLGSMGESIYKITPISNKEAEKKIKEINSKYIEG